jgi:hypothetical protein
MPAKSASFARPQPAERRLFSLNLRSLQQGDPCGGLLGAEETKPLNHAILPLRARRKKKQYTTHDRMRRRAESDFLFIIRFLEL